MVQSVSIFLPEFDGRRWSRVATWAGVRLTVDSFHTISGRKPFNFVAVAIAEIDGHGQAQVDVDTPHYAAVAGARFCVRTFAEANPSASPLLPPKTRSAAIHSQDG